MNEITLQIGSSNNFIHIEYIGDEGYGTVRVWAELDDIAALEDDSDMDEDWELSMFFDGLGLTKDELKSYLRNNR